MNTQNFYDGMVGVLLTNLVTYDNKTISLGNFNPKDENHLCIFHVACIKHDLFRYKIALDLNWFQLLIFKIKNKCWKFVTKASKPTIIDCKKLIKQIEDANNSPDIYKKIYREYYKK